MIRAVRAFAAACVLAGACFTPAPARAQITCYFSKSAECTFLATCAKNPKYTPSMCGCTWAEISKRFPEHQHAVVAEAIGLMRDSGGHDPAVEAAQNEKINRLLGSQGLNGAELIFTLIGVFDEAKRSCPNT